MEYVKFVADFETYTEKGITETWVWGGTIVQLREPGFDYDHKNVLYFHSISEFFEIVERLSKVCNAIIYFHNLKFDGAFILDYLMRSEKYKPALINNHFLEDKFMKNNEYKYLISKMGQWYFIQLKMHKHFIRFMDSLKILPFSVKKIGDDFKTKHRKTNIEYSGYRPEGYQPDESEIEYMKNDVLVVAEALTMFFAEGHEKATIGSNCLSEFRYISKYDSGLDFKKYFPNLQTIELNPEEYGCSNAEMYVRCSYRGGWCYLKKGCEDKPYKKGLTYDVNSLYPSMMHYESGNRYPVGKPTFWKGDYIPEEATKSLRYFFVRFKTSFKIKKGYLPFVQIKGNVLYNGNEMLESSDIELEDGIYKNEPILTMTQTDFYLFKQHYNAKIEILDGCYFDTIYGLFDSYIDKYAKIKKENTGAKRQIAKLFLNNLYGQMAKSPDSSYKIAYFDDDKIRFHTIIEFEKDVVYIPIGSAITSYARNFTINAAQKNYDRFIYADTDSIHCIGKPEDITGITVHPVNFNCWSLESVWSEAIFHRQKTYIEKTESGYDVKCAGMPMTSKKIFIDGLENGTYKLTDFKKGLELNGKLLPKRIKGGIVLDETTYIMRD